MTGRGAWIESHQSLLSHRKTIELAEFLRVNKYQVIGHLHTLWWYALDNVPSDGDLRGASDKTIASAAGWTGKANFAEGLRQVRFISDGKLHNWPDYAGRLQDQRAANRERMRRARAANVQHTNGTRAGATEPYPTQPNTTEPKAAAALSLLANLHEQNIGTISPNRGDELRRWAERLPQDEPDALATIRYAFDETRDNAERFTWRYVEAVLSRLEQEGWPVDD